MMNELYRDFIDGKADAIINSLGGTITPAPSNAELYRDFLDRKFDDVIRALNGSITPSHASDELYRDFIERKFDDVISGIGSYIPPVSFPTVSGSICTFNTALAMPLKSCVVDFQDGTGIDSVLFKHSSHSTVIETLLGEYVDANGRVSQSLSQYPYRCVIARVKQGDTYNYSVNGIASFIPVIAFFDIYPVLGSQSYNSSRLIDQSTTFISPINGYVFIRGSGDFNEVNQMVATGTNTEYEQGNTHTFTFGKTIQNGSLNVLTGELTNNDTTPPEVINLGGVNISLLQGENNIFADTGDTTLQYIKIGGNT